MPTYEKLNLVASKHRSERTSRFFVIRTKTWLSESSTRSATIAYLSHRVVRPLWWAHGVVFTVVTNSFLGWRLVVIRAARRAPVAQLDRASVYGTEGRKFESFRARRG